MGAVPSATRLNPTSKRTAPQNPDAENPAKRYDGKTKRPF